MEMGHYPHRDLALASKEDILQAFTLLHGTAITVNHQEDHTAEGFRNLRHQALEATQQREHVEAAAKASNAEAAEARQVAASGTSEAEGLRQALQASKDEAERFKEEAEASKAQAAKARQVVATVTSEDKRFKLEAEELHAENEALKAERAEVIRWVDDATSVLTGILEDMDFSIQVPALRTP
ncbi:hypothetical protein GUJ93_ZPchr0011g28719 [Zizania palustris]|uniref:Uncharacterized protein n=1 Tax=Zizania palustris TaxID=103762 RepID=A0A8J6BPT9_ZIZPA|nr:hypothetical protein GUJ93_ZPchr0011g28719 [Zizania palustris]